MTDNDTRILLAANRAIRNERVTVSFAADRLRDILRNDNFEPDALDGMEDYLIRSVVEALFGGIEP